VKVEGLNYFAGPSLGNQINGKLENGVVFKARSKEENFIQNDLGWCCHDLYFENEKVEKVYLTKIYSETLWRVLHENGLYNFYDHTVYAAKYTYLSCGDIICETKTWTDKNGDIWIGHQRGWSLLYHSESKTYFMKKVLKEKKW